MFFDILEWASFYLVSGCMSMQNALRNHAKFAAVQSWRSSLSSSDSIHEDPKTKNKMNDNGSSSGSSSSGSEDKKKGKGIPEVLSSSWEDERAIRPTNQDMQSVQQNTQQDRYSDSAKWDMF